MKKYQGLIFSGAAAGAVNGFFGAGGGTVLIPLLQKTKSLPETMLFPLHSDHHAPHLSDLSAFFRQSAAF